MANNEELRFVRGCQGSLGPLTEAEAGRFDQGRPGQPPRPWTRRPPRSEVHRSSKSLYRRTTAIRGVSRRLQKTGETGSLIGR